MFALERLLIQLSDEPEYDEDFKRCGKLSKLSFHPIIKSERKDRNKTREVRCY